MLTFLGIPVKKKTTAHSKMHLAAKNRTKKTAALHASFNALSAPLLNHVNKIARRASALCKLRAYLLWQVFFQPSYYDRISADLIPASALCALHLRETGFASSKHIIIIMGCLSPSMWGLLQDPIQRPPKRSLASWLATPLPPLEIITVFL
jgi:hypothetical protein